MARHLSIPLECESETDFGHNGVSGIQDTGLCVEYGTARGLETSRTDACLEHCHEALNTGRVFPAICAMIWTGMVAGLDIFGLRPLKRTVFLDPSTCGLGLGAAGPGPLEGAGLGGVGGGLGVARAIASQATLA